MSKKYLIRWQIGSNEQSAQNTPIDVIVGEDTTAYTIYADIIIAMMKKTKMEKRLMNILGVYQL